MNDSRDKQMRALVIGCGYLGHALVAALVEMGHECITADFIKEKGENEVNLACRDSVLNLSSSLQKDGRVPACIFLCASTAGGTEIDYRCVYEDGAKHVAEAFPQSKIVMCSSVSVYDVEDGRWVTEVHSCHSSSPKVKSLLAAERTVLSCGGVVARLSAIYGPGRCVLLSRFVHEGKALGEATRWVNYIHRDDAAEALIFLALAKESRGKRFNVSDLSPMSLNEIYGVLSEVLGLPLPEFGAMEETSKRGHSNQRVSCSLLLSMGWQPLYPSFADGIYNVLEESGA